MKNELRKLFFIALLGGGVGGSVSTLAASGAHMDPFGLHSPGSRRGTDRS